MNLIERVERIKRESLEVLKNKIEEGDLDSISFYLTNMHILSHHTFQEICIDKLEKKIENGDLKAISIFYQYCFDGI